MLGYSPFLCFDVQDMDATVVRLLQLGASLDGPIKYPAYGKVRIGGVGGWVEGQSSNLTHGLVSMDRWAWCGVRTGT